jgi:hypothetical protein
MTGLNPCRGSTRFYIKSAGVRPFSPSYLPADGPGRISRKMVSTMGQSKGMLASPPPLRKYQRRYWLVECDHWRAAELVRLDQVVCRSSSSSAAFIAALV